jgi:hypothetical protein
VGAQRLSLLVEMREIAEGVVATSSLGGFRAGTRTLTRSRSRAWAMATYRE